MAARTDYPVHVDVDYPERSSRGLALLAILFFLKGLLLFPHFVVLWFLSIVAFVCLVIGYFAVLFTGVYPRSLFNLVMGVLRWQTRVTAWLYGLTDKYPPFSLS
ncbi:MAG: DUF4389 domain-containing protein [Chloroflexi bacterium]|nr:DUF4389 domain-containing protein [Chloroflexota bacterium]